MPHDKPKEEVLKEAKWNSLFKAYKLKLVGLIYNMFTDATPPSMANIITKHTTRYNLSKR